MKKTISLLTLPLLLTFLCTTLVQASTTAQLLDDFEGYTSEKQFQRIWSSWEEGAEMALRLEDSGADDHGMVMAVEMLALSEGDQPNIGSVFALLYGEDRDWQQGKGLSFWLDNTSGDNLFLSLNFKEQYNEFWATTDGGPVFLQPDGGVYQQSRIEFGNIPIPADFRGTITVPFTSFAVPEWNTANGDGQIDLKAVESLGFAVMAQEELPFTFTLDDFEVQRETFDTELSIVGPDYIYLPGSGAHIETYTAELTSVTENSSASSAISWEIVSPQDDSAVIDQDGQLTIQHDFQGNQVLLAATYQSEYGPVSQEYPVTIGSAAADEAGLSTVDEMPPDEMQSQTEPTQLEQISQTYNSWLENYRLLTVIVSVLVVLAIVFVFAYVELKLR